MGKQQHGFKKNRSTATATATAGLLLQSLIARNLDDDNFTAMASAAIDIVNENVTT